MSKRSAKIISTLTATSASATSAPAPATGPTFPPPAAGVNAPPAPSPVPATPAEARKPSLRQRFTEHLILQQKAPRTVQAYVAWVRDCAVFLRKAPDLATPEELRSWFLHLITVRQLSASSVNLALNALRHFHGAFLGRDFAPLLQGIKRPARKPQPPRIFSAGEIEQLINVGAAGDPLGRIFLMTVFGCGLRLSEATHVQIADLDSARLQLRVSHPKGGRERVVPISRELLAELRLWWKVHRPVRWLFSQGPDQDPICKGTAQNLYYRALRRSGLRKKLGIHALRHTFATLMLENGVEITVVQKLLGHASLSSTVRYLHVRQERLGQIRSPLGLLRIEPVTTSPQPTGR